MVHSVADDFQRERDAVVGIGVGNILRVLFRPNLFDLRPRAYPAGELSRWSISLRSILGYLPYLFVSEQDRDGLIKKIACYHEIRGVLDAVRRLYPK